MPWSQWRAGNPWAQQVMCFAAARTRLLVLMVLGLWQVSFCYQQSMVLYSQHALLSPKAVY